MISLFLFLKGIGGFIVGMKKVGLGKLEFKW